MGKYEFTAPYLLCCSDAETFSVREILDLTHDQKDRDLWEKLTLGYTEVKGHPLLREQIRSNLYPNLDTEHILCFGGAEEGIFCALNVLCKPDDHIIVHTPCYQSLLQIPIECGSEVTELELQENNGWRVDLHRLRGAVKENTKLIIINFPHNPTGQVISQEDLQAVIDLCREKDIWLFSDEVYRLLGNPSTPWAEPAACLYEKALSLGVMSKSFGLAGLRIGWIACQNPALLLEFERMKYYTSICNSAPSEILAYLALKQLKPLIDRNNRIVADNLQRLNEFVEEYSHIFDWVIPQGGCVGFMHYKGTRQTMDEFCANLVREKGVLIMPASQFGKNIPYFRIGFGRKNMIESLQRLREFINEHSDEI